MELEYIPVECANCGHVTHILGATAVRPWKLFERDCAKCEDTAGQLRNRRGKRRRRINREDMMEQKISERVKRDAHQYRLLQAERLLVAHGYKKLSNGGWVLRKRRRVNK